MATVSTVKSFAAGEVLRAADMNTYVAQVTGLPNRNIVINGGMDIWQRNTSSSANSTYSSADRWWNYYNAGTTTFSRESSVVPTGLQYALKLSQATATASAVLYQAIETANAINLAGKNVTFSAYLASSIAINIDMTISYSTSVDNSVNGTWTSITGTSQAVANTSTYSRYYVTGAVPSTAKSLRIEFVVNSLTVGAAFYLSGVQLEEGSAATSFRRNGNTIQGELAACQRYYQVDAAQTYLNATSAGLSNSYVGSKAFLMEMRTTPTLTIYPADNLSGVAGKATMYPPGTAQTMTVEVLTNKHFQMQYPGINTYNLAIFTWKAEAEL